MGTVSKWSQARVTGVTEEIELYKTKRHLFRLINALSLQTMPLMTQKTNWSCGQEQDGNLGGWADGC